jgi:type II secretory pathway predicted ATPase ExeA
MFLEDYGLREEPFGMTPDPAYLYASRTHSKALASLSLGIEDTRGFLALIAEPGMGKTTLLYQLAEEWRDTTRTVFISQTQCTSREFIEYILQDLGVDTRGMGFVAMHGQLNEILFEELLAGKRFVLIVDEAQNLDDTVLETIRMLSNFETHNAKLLQIILAGQPLLAAKLAQPRLSQLRQRVAVLSHLDPFTAEETGRYIEHRLSVAGYHGEPIFEQASIALIARQCKGIPRNINNLCYHSLRLAHAHGHRMVSVGVVQEAVAELDMDFLPTVLVAAKPIAAEPVATEPVKVADSITIPLAVPKPPKDSASTPISTPAPNSTPGNKIRQASSFLTYDSSKKVGPPKWPARSAAVAVILLLGTFFLAILGRSESRRRITSETFDHSSDASIGAEVPSEPESAVADYDADPRDTGNGQVITVAAGSQQTMKDLSLRYLGRFDSELSNEILSLNPDLKDADHLLEPGQLIRIPLPPGAMKKVNDTADAGDASQGRGSNSLLAKFEALLRPKK